MEPTITNLDKAITLIKAITINGKETTEITLEKMILRPVMKRIVFITKELDRVIAYDGEEDFEAHKNDAEEVLIAQLLKVIDDKY